MLNGSLIQTLQIFICKWQTKAAFINGLPLKWNYSIFEFKSFTQGKNAS